MIRKQMTLLAIASLSNAVHSQGISRSPPIGGKQIIEAINKEICFDSFWQGGTYNLGSTVPLYISRSTEGIEAWSNHLLSSRGKFITHFAIKTKHGTTFVDHSESYNERYFPEKVSSLRQREVIVLPVARHCVPMPPKNSDKVRLIQKIAANELTSLDAFARRNRSSRIVIANVDESYPHSLVYVPDKDELFTVTVSPGTSYTYRPDGPYLIGQINNKAHVAAIRAKILKYGRRVSLR